LIRCLSAIIVTGSLIDRLGDGLDGALNPRLRNR